MQRKAVSSMVEVEGSAVQAVLMIVAFIFTVITTKNITDYIIYLIRKAEREE